MAEICSLIFYPIPSCRDWVSGISFHPRGSLVWCLCRKVQGWSSLQWIIHGLPTYSLGTWEWQFFELSGCNFFWRFDHQDLGCGKGKVQAHTHRPHTACSPDSQPFGIQGFHFFDTFLQSLPKVSKASVGLFFPWSWRFCSVLLNGGSPSVASLSCPVFICSIFEHIHQLCLRIRRSKPSTWPAWDAARPSAGMWTLWILSPFNLSPTMSSQHLVTKPSPFGICVLDFVSKLSMAMPMRAIMQCSIWRVTQWPPAMQMALSSCGMWGWCQNSCRLIPVAIQPTQPTLIAVGKFWLLRASAQSVLFVEMKWRAHAFSFLKMFWLSQVWWCIYQDLQHRR